MIYKLNDIITRSNTGLDAIRRAPIVERETGIKCIRITDISQKKLFDDWGNTEVLESDFDKFQLKKEDILIARTGATIGVNRIINEDLKLTDIGADGLKYQHRSLNLLTMSRIIMLI